MIELPVIQEAQRVLTICNACRYCEGVCPVFPALERRRTFAASDAEFLANLCHGCNACYHVCPYAPPHELNLNFPAAMADVRETTYSRYAWPTLMSRLFRYPVSGSLIVTALLVALVTLLVAVTRPDQLFQTVTGPGAFYEVVPFLAMLIPGMIAGVYVAGLLALGGYRFWTSTGGDLRSLLDLRAWLEATGDVLSLRQMRGGGAGCYHPDDVPGNRKRVLHSLVFYGFLGTFLSTTLAAVYQDVLGIEPPFDYLSPVVITGTVGGIAVILGCLGLLVLKVGSTPTLTPRAMLQLDVAFIVMLLLANVTGLLLLVLRETSWLSLMLAIHLGVIGALFITLPYGKLVHAVYRYAALVRDRSEQSAGADAPGARSTH